MGSVYRVPLCLSLDSDLFLSLVWRQYLHVKHLCTTADNTGDMNEYVLSFLVNFSPMSKQDHLDSNCPNVHSANAWETVDLGSPDRNEKFLRLMGGATSREHKGSIIIGEYAGLPHRQTGSSQTKMAGELESQFCEGVDRRARLNEHQGLGSLPKSDNSSSLSHEASDKSSLRGQYSSSFVPAQQPHS
ncbi:hypothetical protein AHF37_09474 [Paragonimus kellicotti]|nr:hypothetical protein AHF37_09474 [Paragonimus kellicotti]